MQKPGSSRCLMGFVIAALVTLATLFLPRAAFASGTVSAKSTQLDEADGKWKLELTIDYGSVPDLNIVPMDFVFTPTVYDEFACDEAHKDKPFHNRKPLVNQSSITIPADVGFADAMGKTFRKTKYVFVLKRDDRFEAGEYSFEVKKDGHSVGSKMTITLKGENRVVDRRPMDMGAKHSKDDPCQPKAETASSTTPASTSDTPKDSGSSESGSSDKPADGDTGSGASDPNASSGQVPPEKGCKCTAAGLGNDGVEGAAVMALAGFAAFGVRRRRAA